MADVFIVISKQQFIALQNIVFSIKIYIYLGFVSSSSVYKSAIKVSKLHNPLWFTDNLKVKQNIKKPYL